MRISLMALALLGAASSACTLGNLTPQARLSESVHTLTEATRWGHVDMAMPHVSAKYTETFLTRHANWGNSFSIADTELVRVQLSDDRKSAMSEVAVSWYPVGQVSLRQSIITQQWERESGSFRLVSEVVRSGDSSVFTEPASADSSGGG